MEVRAAVAGLVQVCKYKMLTHIAQGRTRLDLHGFLVEFREFQRFQVLRILIHPTQGDRAPRFGVYNLEFRWLPPLVFHERDQSSTTARHFGSDAQCR